MNPPKVVFALCLAGLTLLTTLIVASSFEMSLGAGLERVAATRWGVTTLVDLYLGLAVIGVWIASIERTALRTLPWIVALALTGNFATLVYVALRARRARTLREIIMPHAPSR
ncbi:MAG: DUF1475 domain-containing protein [Phycisphaerales bacterium]|nr:MAG: DUF1475 domain-containing protein [Phycisphaerales bacterium]